MRKTFIVISILFAGLVLWMNVTPGHFRKKCCSVIHETDMEYIKDGPVPMCKCKPFSIGKLFLLTVANLDIYK